jgi:hypothetical protein
LNDSKRNITNQNNTGKIGGGLRNLDRENLQGEEPKVFFQKVLKIFEHINFYNVLIL